MSLAHHVEILALLGDESRLRLCALLRRRELSVSQLVRITGLTQSRVSTHLARLREGGLVRDRREGQHSFYSLMLKTMSAPLQAMIQEIIEAEDLTLGLDRKRLEELELEQNQGLPFAVEAGRYAPGRTWQSLAVGLSGLLSLGDVLDIGSGDGAVASYIAPFCRSLVCVDCAPRKVEAARARLQEHQHVRVELADISALSFQNASFDQVLIFHTLAHVEHPSRVIGQSARVLRPGGRLVVLSLDEHEHTELTAPHGELHPGFSTQKLRGMLTRAHLEITFCKVACREVKKPYFQTVLAIATQPITPKER